MYSNEVPKQKQQAHSQAQPNTHQPNTQQNGRITLDVLHMRLDQPTHRRQRHVRPMRRNLSYPRERSGKGLRRGSGGPHAPFPRWFSGGHVGSVLQWEVFSWS
jgi:hypothetical protein